MRRSELLATIAGVLPIGALAVVRVPEQEVPAVQTAQLPAAPRETVKWMIVHPAEGKRLARNHEVGDDCVICGMTGVPWRAWQPPA